MISFPQGIRLQSKGAQQGDLSVDKTVFEEFKFATVDMTDTNVVLTQAQLELDCLRLGPVSNENKTLTLPTGTQIIEATKLEVGESKEFHIHLNGDLGDDGAGADFLLTIQKTNGDGTLSTDDGDVVRVVESHSKTTLVLLRESSTSVRVM